MKRRTAMMALCLVLILSMLIAPMGASAASKNKKQVVRILKVTVDGARLRKGPSSAYDIITSIKKDGKVFYWGKTTNSFSYVRTSTGQVGYMYKGFLKAYGAANRNQVYYCKVKSAQLYKRSGKSLKKAGKLTKYQHVIVYEVRGSWAYIKTLDGAGRYIKKSVLAKA